MPEVQRERQFQRDLPQVQRIKDLRRDLQEVRRFWLAQVEALSRLYPESSYV